MHLHRSNVNAIATLWLYTLTDHEELEVTLPIYRSKDLEQLKQNVSLPYFRCRLCVVLTPLIFAQYINDFTKRTHEYKQVGTLTTKVVFRSGLGPSHYSSPANGPSGSKGRRHALEAWDVYHGQAILAQRKAEAEADGSTDHQLRKDLKRATSRQKQYHQTGKYEVGAVRCGLLALCPICTRKLRAETRAHLFSSVPFSGPLRVFGRESRRIVQPTSVDRLSSLSVIWCDMRPRATLGPTPLDCGNAPSLALSRPSIPAFAFVCLLLAVLFCWTSCSGG